MLTSWLKKQKKKHYLEISEKPLKPETKKGDRAKPIASRKVRRAIRGRDIGLPCEKWFSPQIAR